jgi:hypothetical protein
MKKPKSADLAEWASVIAILVAGFLSGLGVAPLMIHIAWDFWN